MVHIKEHTHYGKKKTLKSSQV
uniref:Uncharacterized protein n=1 Tax=Arundo donax TaxID=35708 RepID=A0A0A9AMM5_ARUDO